MFQTRKGEKRRVPNGERKRKSGTGSAPENCATGAFRAVSNGGLATGKNQDGGPSDPKRPALDRSLPDASQRYGYTYTLIFFFSINFWALDFLPIF